MKLQHYTSKNVKEELSTIVYTTPLGKTITFNEQQTDAILDIQDWLKDKTNYEYTLAGFAGTGKSTLINYIIKGLPKVAVSAPTHKAKTVIAKLTGKQAETIQKLLGLRPNTDLEDFDIKNPQFDPIAKPLIADYRIVVIDEASMLSKDLYTYLVKEATQARTKLIFMADSAQLPPINELLSEVFKVKNQYQLTKVERQSSDNPLMKIYDSIRDNIYAKEDVFPHEDAILGDKGILFIKDEEKFTEIVIEKFKESTIDNKITTYTNDRVKYWNNIVRNKVLKNPDTILVKDDCLMSYVNIIQNKQQVIFNSADYKVLNVSDRTNNHDIKIYVVEVVDIDDQKASSIFLNFVVPDLENLVKFRIIHNQFLTTAKNARGNMRASMWAQYFEFKNKHLLMSRYMDMEKDFDYGYACSVHKIQGSTYKNVFVDESSIDMNKKHSERNKLKYVAFSRPTHMVYSLYQTQILKELTEADRLLLEIYNQPKEDTHEKIISYLTKNKFI